MVLPAPHVEKEPSRNGMALFVWIMISAGYQSFDPILSFWQSGFDFWRLTGQSGSEDVRKIPRKIFELPAQNEFG